ncbi:MAG: glucosaminidase domain-containing protein, partial [Bacteroidia bacterium]|nr:glucosaminidase domain-containing protein [Bacteroidia bacterium]
MRRLRNILFLVSFSGGSFFAQPGERKNTPEDYISKYKEDAIIQMHLYGIPASITLAQGMLESGNGNSALSVYANNHFGIKCHKEWTGESYIMDDDASNECFRKYG